MSKTFLEKIRELNELLSESATGYIAFDELCNSIGELLNSDVYVMSKKGKVLATKHLGEPVIRIEKTNGVRTLPAEVNRKLLTYEKTEENVVGDRLKEIYGEDYSESGHYHVILPVIFGGNRIATVVTMRPDGAYSEEDLALCEYAATVVGLQVSRAIALEEEADSRERSAVVMALDTLSYSELDAVAKIFGELDGDEGLLVASKVADKYNITRSVIVNALRKLESAGVIESRSLGMKGTRIKITNDFLREEIDGMDI